MSVDARHHRVRVMAGVSQERMARNALGQQGGWGWWGKSGPPLWALVGARVRRGGVQGSRRGEPLVPAEGEGAVDQGLVTADGAVGADLEVGPAKFVLDLLVTLLNPWPQAVEADDLGEVGRWVRAGGGVGCVGVGQVGGQVPGGLLRQGGRVGGGHDQSAGSSGRSRPGGRRRPTRFRCARRGSDAPRVSSRRGAWHPSRSGRERLRWGCAAGRPGPRCRGAV